MRTLSETVLCLDCLAVKTGLPIAEIEQVLHVLRRAITVDALRPCHACKTRRRTIGIKGRPD